jgi:large subunit ribosomal protein L13
VDTLSYRTQSAKKETVKQDWTIVDAEGQPLGRLASVIAKTLRGKHKVCYTPHVDCGDYVIVINAEKVRLTGGKMKQKVYLRHSGYPGGQKSKTAAQIIDQHPHRLMEIAVKGMLPKTKLGRAMYKKLFVYAGAEHPHKAQKPSKLETK